jgi:probable rRNA maturation factor
VRFGLELLRASADPDVPADEAFERWLLLAALAERRTGSRLVLAVVDEDEGRRLHARHLGSARASNVLAFPPAPPAPGAFLGDLVLCAPVVRREARRQGKSLEAHYAHLALHGFLHLLGYRHERPTERRRMERRERVLLAALGYPDPYRAGSGGCRG